MLLLSKFLYKPLKAEYLMILAGLKTAVMILTICWLMVVANAVAAATQQHQQHQQLPQTFNYKQQLQYQMQQHDKFQYQQHIKQQQQYYQQQQHQQSPAAIASEQQQQQQQQRLPQQYLPAKPTQMLQTAASASLVVDDAQPAEGQAEYASGNMQRRRPGARKRKRRPQLSTAEVINSPTAANLPPYWRGQVEENTQILDNPSKPLAINPQDNEEVIRPSLQASFKRRKQPLIREPLAALEKEQKLYEMRTKPETSSEGNANLNSANIKNILKNSGGLSLSEILQQKNLSLDDLLKGKQNALQALQTTAMAPPEKVNHVKYTSFKANFKPLTPTLKVSESSEEELQYNSKERSKLTALQRLKLFGSSSRPTGLQVDHLTTRKREGGLYVAATTITSSTTTTKPSTTKIPLYKKILHQRPTLKPTFLLKNTPAMGSAETYRLVTSWDSKELLENKDETESQDGSEDILETKTVKDKEEEDVEGKGEEEREGEELELEDAEQEEDLKLRIEDEEAVKELSTKLPEITTWRAETTTTPMPTTTTTTTTTSIKPATTERITNRDLSGSTRRMFTSTRGSGRTTYRYSSSNTNPAATTKSAATTTTTTTTTTSPTPPTTTTTTTTSTTTASSSTMNLTPKAHLNLNTEDLRERIQETLLKNLIEKEDSFKKSSPMQANSNEGVHNNSHDHNDDDDDDDLENFFEETVKPKTNKYFETSTITTRMKQYTPSFIYTTSTSSTSSPVSSTSAVTSTATVNLNTENVIPDFDNVDDRTDLLELIEDRRSGNRLFKVLEQRNMTLEELIEHRKRGSSQLHLATIVETPSRYYPDKKVVLQDNMDIVTAFENFPHFNLLNLKSVKPDDIKTDSQGSSYFTSIIDIEPTDEVYKKRNADQALTGGELDKVSLLADRSEKSLSFFPSWKSLALASLANNNNKDDDDDDEVNANANGGSMRKIDTNPYYLQQPKMLLENNSEINGNIDGDVYDFKGNELNLIGRDHDDNNGDDDDADNADIDNDADEFMNENSPVGGDYLAQKPIQAAVRLPDHTAEAIENEVARAHDLVDLELSGHGFKRSPQAAGALAHSNRRGSFYTNMPPGIKSAIVASATIVLTALITFMVIFAVCKWKQRRHRMTNIMKSYNAMKSKLPTIAAATSMAAGLNVNSSGSRRSSFREMQDLLGGSGLSVAATITTTSTGVPNTPIHSYNASSITKIPSTTLNGNAAAAQTTTTTLVAKQNSQPSKHLNNMYVHNNSSNNISSSSSSHSNSCVSRPLQRQSSLLFQKSFRKNCSNNSNNEKPTNLSILSGCNLLDLKRNSKMSGSTTSLSFSLTSGHNISNSHINTMDANSPEVQEYLFDTLRNSF